MTVEPFDSCVVVSSRNSALGNAFKLAPRFGRTVRGALAFPFWARSRQWSPMADSGIAMPGGRAWHTERGQCQLDPNLDADHRLCQRRDDVTISVQDSSGRERTQAMFICNTWLSMAETKENRECRGVHDRRDGFDSGSVTSQLPSAIQWQGENTSNLEEARHLCYSR